MNDDRGLQIKSMLDKNSLSQTWLIRQLKQKGLDYDKSTVSSALKGTIKGERANKIIAASYEILCNYEAKMNFAY